MLYVAQRTKRNYDISKVQITIQQLCFHQFFLKLSYVDAYLSLLSFFFKTSSAFIARPFLRKAIIYALMVTYYLQSSAFLTERI